MCLKQKKSEVARDVYGFSLKSISRVASFDVLPERVMQLNQRSKVVNFIHYQSSSFEPTFLSFFLFVNVGASFGATGTVTSLHAHIYNIYIRLINSYTLLTFVIK